MRPVLEIRPHEILMDRIPKRTRPPAVRQPRNPSRTQGEKPSWAPTIHPHPEPSSTIDFHEHRRAHHTLEIIMAGGGAFRRPSPASITPAGPTQWPADTHHFRKSDHAGESRESPGRNRAGRGFSLAASQPGGPTPDPASAGIQAGRPRDKTIPAVGDNRHQCS